MKLGNFCILRKNRNGSSSLLKLVKNKGWLAPEAFIQGATFTYAIDLFAFGCVIGYCLERHPFGECKEERTIHIKNSQPIVLTLADLSNVEDAHEAFNLINLLVNYNPTMRPSAYEILKHPYFTGTDTAIRTSTGKRSYLAHIFVIALG